MVGLVQTLTITFLLMLSSFAYTLYEGSMCCDNKAKTLWQLYVH